jgi:hypothetical protein
VLALLIGWLARREWIWFLFIVATIGAGATAYTRARRDSARSEWSEDGRHS